MSDAYEHNQRTPLGRAVELAGLGDGGAAGSDDARGPLKLMVVDRKGDFLADVELAVQARDVPPKIVHLTHPTHMLDEVGAESPDVLLASPDEMTPTGLRRLASVHKAHPTLIIALSQTDGASAISASVAAECGARAVIPYPASKVKLRNAMGRLLTQAEKTVAAERVVVKVLPPEPVYVPAPSQRPMAQVFTVTSPTGGCGKTFFATNLAAYLAGATGGRVLLVDLDLQFGEVSLALGLRPQRTISELINESSLLDAFPDYVVDHRAGYKVLSAPADPFAAELVGPREATQVLDVARELYDFVVVDTPPSLNEVVLAAFDVSRFLVVMATVDVPSLRNLRVFLETIERLKLPADEVNCVLNKAEPNNGIDLNELLRIYPGGFAAVLPYAKEVSRSLNVGQPVLMSDGRAEISQKILEACARLVPSSAIKHPWLPQVAKGRSGRHKGREDRGREDRGREDRGREDRGREDKDGFAGMPLPPLVMPDPATPAGAAPQVHAADRLVAATPVEPEADLPKRGFLARLFHRKGGSQPDHLPPRHSFGT